MDFNFIKDIFKPIVGDLRADSSLLESFIADRDNNFILKHNLAALSKMIKFLNSPENNIFILNGFMGAGKTSVTDCLVDFINNNVLVFRNSYQEAINLDDILLSLFKDFTIYHNDKKIILPKSETTIFSEKINTYIKYCDAPMVFIFDSLEINMRSKDTQKDILDFLNYLSHFSKIKIIICSRTFKQDDLISSDSSESAQLASLSLDEMYEYLEINNIKGNKYECESLYKIIRGHYLLLELSVLIMQLLNISLTIFLSEYKKSAKNFLEFLISKVLSISSERYIKSLLFLSTVRHGVSADFLINQNFVTEDEINFLLEKHVLSEKMGKYYLKDYIKTEFIKSINIETKIRIHKYLVDVYEAELPLKPFDRELFLSRLTMRQEIAFHTKRIETLEKEFEKNGMPRLSEAQGLTYLSYSRKSGFESRMENKKVIEKKYAKNIKPYNDKHKRFELSNEDSKLLNATKSQDIITKKLVDISNIELQEKEQKQEKSALNSIPQSLEDYIEIAQNCEENYNFSDAIMYYKKALTYTNDDMFKVKEPILYTKLAICYKKIQDVDNAVNYYEKVYQLYLNETPDKANEILLSIAQIYLEVYKIDKAKEIYKRILYSPVTVSSEMVVRVYLELSEIEDNNLDMEAAIQYLKKALATAEKTTDTKLLCECYFKYALLLDDSGNVDMALKYYLRCVQLCDDAQINAYLASAYSNIAEISYDSKNNSAAKMYYELSINADKDKNNYEGLYYSYTKLAQIHKEEGSDKVHEMLLNALAAAKKLDDTIYTVTIYTEMGDNYLASTEYKQALKSYILALTFIPSDSSKDIEEKIKAKINKIKSILGDVEFMKLMNEIKKRRL